MNDGVDNKPATAVEPAAVRHCSRCDRTKPLVEPDGTKNFYGRTSPYCIPCVKDYQNIRNARKRARQLTSDDPRQGLGPPPPAAVLAPVGPPAMSVATAPLTIEGSFIIGMIDAMVHLKTQRLPPTGCVCCFSTENVTRVLEHRLCGRCRHSVDICGVCILHPNGPVFRPELTGRKRPLIEDVLRELGELPPADVKFSTTAQRLARKQKAAALAKYKSEENKKAAKKRVAAPKEEEPEVDEVDLENRSRSTVDDGAEEKELDAIEEP